MKIIVGSMNPVKKLAVEQAFKLYFGQEIDIQVICQDAPSEVGEQPMNANETARGAYNRAKYLAEKHPDTDYTVGIEGGLNSIDIGKKYEFEQTWACVFHVPSNKYQFGSGPAYGIGDKVASHIHKGLDLSEAMHLEYGEVDLGKTNGYNGWLSNNHYDRTESSKIAVFLAICQLNLLSM